MNKVRDECNVSSSTTVFHLGHRVATRSRQEKETDDTSDSDRMRDLISLRCRDLPSLTDDFFRGYRDGFTALMNSRSRPTDAVRLAQESSRERITGFCGQTQNRDTPPAIAFVTPLEQAKPEQAGDWQTGILIDTTAEKRTKLFGSFNDSHGIIIEKRNDATYYEIESGDYIYIAKRTLTKRWDKQLLVTVNGPVTFHIKGSDFYLIADDSKQHKLSLEKKTLKKGQ